MASIDPSTPQSAVVKKWLESYMSLDVKNLEPLLSKNFRGHRYPKSPDLPDETKETHLKAWETRLAVMEKVEMNSQEIIEAPGKAVVHVSTMSHTVAGDEFSFDIVFILTFVEEDGELKILHYKSFADAVKRRALFAWADNAQAQGSATS